MVKLDLNMDPDPHSEKMLDPDPHKMNADPQPCLSDKEQVVVLAEVRSC